jgi:hypothetical protein
MVLLRAVMTADSMVATRVCLTVVSRAVMTADSKAPYLDSVKETSMDS